MFWVYQTNSRTTPQLAEYYLSVQVITGGQARFSEPDLDLRGVVVTTGTNMIDGKYLGRRLESPTQSLPGCCDSQPYKELPGYFKHPKYTYFMEGKSLSIYVPVPLTPFPSPAMCCLILIFTATPFHRGRAVYSIEDRPFLYLDKSTAYIQVLGCTYKQWPASIIFVCSLIEFRKHPTSYRGHMGY